MRPRRLSMRRRAREGSGTTITEMVPALNRLL
jgi:hypothetical protein